MGICSMLRRRKGRPGSAAEFEFMVRLTRLNDLSFAYVLEILVCIEVGGMSNRSITIAGMTPNGLQGMEGKWAFPKVSLCVAKAAAKTPAVLAKSLPDWPNPRLGSRANVASRSQGETRASMNCHGLFIPLGRRWSCKPSLETGRCPILKVKGNSAISQMKVAFLCPSLSRTSFGIFETQRRLAQCLQELHETEVEVFGPADEHTDRDRHQWFPINPHCFKALGPRSFRYSPDLQRHFLRSGARHCTPSRPLDVSINRDSAMVEEIWKALCDLSEWNARSVGHAEFVLEKAIRATSL